MRIKYISKLYTAIFDPKQCPFLESQTFLSECFGGDNRTGCLCATRQGTACITFRYLLMKPKFTLKYCEVHWKQKPPLQFGGASADIVLPSCLVALGDWSRVSKGATGPVERAEVKLIWVPCTEWMWRHILHSNPPRGRGMYLDGGWNWGRTHPLAET